MKINRTLLIAIIMITLTALLYVAGIPLTSAGVIIAATSIVIIVVEGLRAREIVSENTYWPVLLLGEGIVFILAGLIVKGVIPLVASITGDALIDAFIVSTLVSVAVVIAVQYVPKLFARVTGGSVAPEVYSSPYLE